MELGHVEAAARGDHRGHRLRPPVDVRQPVQRAQPGIDDVEPATAERLDRLVEVRGQGGPDGSARRAAPVSPGDPLSRRTRSTRTSPRVPGVACSDSDNPDDYAAWSINGAIADARFGSFGRLWTWASSICAEWPGADRDRYKGPFMRRTANPVRRAVQPARAAAGGAKAGAQEPESSDRARVEQKARFPSGRAGLVLGGWDSNPQPFG